MRPTQPKADTDVILVVTSGSDIVQAAVQELVISGAPVVVLAESSVEAPYIERDTPMLGLICATEADHLLDSLASWILSRTEKAMPLRPTSPLCARQSRTRSCVLQR